MRRSRFIEEQIVTTLAEADRGEQTIREICRAHGVFEATFYTWQKRFRGMGVEEAPEYRGLKWETAWLKELLADRELEIDAMKENGVVMSFVRGADAERAKDQVQRTRPAVHRHRGCTVGRGGKLAFECLASRAERKTSLEIS